MLACLPWHRVKTERKEEEAEQIQLGRMNEENLKRQVFEAQW